MYDIDFYGLRILHGFATHQDTDVSFPLYLFRVICSCFHCMFVFAPCLLCNTRFLTLSYSFRYRTIGLLHYWFITSPLSAVVRRISGIEIRSACKQISVNAWNKLSCCLYLYGSLQGQSGSSAAIAFPSFLFLTNLTLFMILDLIIRL